jgi:hypothetical protein
MAMCITAGAFLLEFCGVVRQADEIHDRLVAIMDAVPERERFSFAWLGINRIGRTCYRDLDPWRGLEHARLWLDRARAIGHQRLQGTCNLLSGFCYAALGAASDAHAFFQRSGLKDEETGAMSSTRPVAQAWLAFQGGALEDAHRHALRLLEFGRRRGLALDESRGHWILAEVRRRSGDHAAAEAAAEAALALAVPIDRPVILATLAGARLAQGRTMEALAAAEDAMAHYRELGFCSHFFGTALLRVVHTECLLAVEQRERARDAAADAKLWLLGIAAKIGDPQYRASFLEAVPEHRRILALAGAVDGGDRSS